jgi:hypothetical protein
MMGTYLYYEGKFPGPDLYVNFSLTGLIVNFGAGLIGAVTACYLFYRKGKPQDAEYEVIEVHDLEE